MMLAVTTFSIRPGGTPKVKGKLAEALQSPPLATAAPVTLATEIGEVNTLTCLFACADISEDLQALKAWIDPIYSSEIAGLLRSVTVDLFSAEADSARLQAMVAPGVAAVLLQEYTAFNGPSRPEQLRLTSHTGRHGMDWILTPVATPDDALALSLQATNSAPGELLRSRMLLPVR